MHCCAFVSVGVPAEFTVFTKEAGEGDVDVRVIDNNGKKVPVDIKDNKDGTYTIIYYPTAVGSYSVNITFNSESIPKSPFKVNVCQTNCAACRAYGPGLEKVTKKHLFSSPEPPGPLNRRWLGTSVMQNACEIRASHAWDIGA